ncbi:hypothetical protein [Burkholderia sp. Bp8963]|nr:hypothetical protein [Burkholderia sp. Bp8963]
MKTKPVLTSDDVKTMAAAAEMKKRLVGRRVAFFPSARTKKVAWLAVTAA